MERGRKILVAYDGSELSEKAITEATEQMKIHPRSMLAIILVVTKDNQDTNQASETLIKLDHLIEALELSGIKAKKEVISDSSEKNPGGIICAYVAEKNVDLIIVGSRGLSTWKTMVLGSVSTTIVQRADCHVLIVK